ncbi:MAG TPA: GNAT family N-acetyltransferase [Solirubrobacteraceae bacterium]|nr:GNAT family N-acetyltransferase [Solirubrobacteraceae bacterium]
METSGAGRGKMPVRVATRPDLDGVTETVWAAFREDPLWSWAFPDPGAMRPWWRFLIASALRYPSVFVAGEYAAVSVWIPAGGSELTDREEAQLEPLLAELLDTRAPDVLELLDRFEASHPRDRPHYYLSLLGTHPDHRGGGLGMQLLAENLDRMDALGIPAYLESSNPANDPRYERLGFRRIGEFSTPDGSRVVGTMWREPGASGVRPYGQ